MPAELGLPRQPSAICRHETVDMGQLARRSASGDGRSEDGRRQVPDYGIVSWRRDRWRVGQSRGIEPCVLAKHPTWPYKGELVRPGPLECSRAPPESLYVTPAPTPRDTSSDPA